MRTQSKMPVCKKQERGHIARKKLIEAGLKIYSEVGYAGASTRKLAATAGVNIAAIPYYFGNKEGLYLAVINHIVEYYQSNLGDGLAGIRQALASGKTTTADCFGLLDGYVGMLVKFVLRETDECSRISRIYIREQLDPTSAFERLYDGFIRDMRRTLEALIASIVGGDVPTAEVKIIAETILGQVAIFKSSRVTVLHNMGWNSYGDKKMAEIERIVIFNVNALMQAYQKRNEGV